MFHTDLVNVVHFQQVFESVGQYKGTEKDYIAIIFRTLIQTLFRGNNRLLNFAFFVVLF